MSIEFSDWLNKQMRRHGWDPKQLAHFAKLSPSTVSRITKGDRRPGLHTCLMLSKAFRLPIDHVLKITGYATNGSNNNSDYDEMAELLKQLTSEERDFVTRICEGLIISRNP